MKQNMPENKPIRISVIIPVYRPGSRIIRCLRSLQEQTLNEIEMIFVDDCGKDGSMLQVESAADKDHRIRIIRNPRNLGPGPSRNRGISTAAGEYLAFIDADDYVEIDFLECLYRKVPGRKPDIIKGEIIYELADGTRTAEKADLNSSIRNGLSAGKPLYGLFRYEHQSAIYRHSFVADNHLKYGSSRLSEDSTFLLRACLAAMTFETENQAYYHYVSSGTSLSCSITAESLRERVRGFEEQIQSLSAVVTQNDRDASEYIWQRISYNLRIQACASKIKELEIPSAEFLNDLRTIVRKLPQAGSLRREFFGGLALIDYGVNLSTNPYSSLWEKAGPRAYLDVISRWVIFALRHPRHIRVCWKHIYRILNNCMSNIGR